MKRVTLQMIADRTGYSRNTVSCALRNHPSIPKATCERIQAAADAIGYRPDPRLSELMTYLNVQRRAPAQTVLAFVHDWPGGFLHPEHDNDPSCYLGAKKRAESLGYVLEEFVLNRAKMTDQRLSRILSARGIRGILFGPMQHSRTSLQLIWKSFCSVAIGFTVQSPRLNRASNYQFYSLQRILRKVTALGYRHPAVWLPSRFNLRVDDAWYAAHALEEKISGQSIPFVERAANSAVEISRFIRRRNVDALITFLPPVMLAELTRIEEKSIPHRLGIINVHRTPSKIISHISGIDQQWESVGAAAIDMLVSELNLNHLGLPENPKTLFIEGRWVDGETTRRKPPAALQAAPTLGTMPRKRIATAERLRRSDGA
ncbi:MAG TPA: LacI family DNA-binding transcriptional regulator [Chthoniobacteraceae bacterium]|nr:LacI family DNA-binding transcriptional regulator [Chthoniobacteraceae bacterium]